MVASASTSMEADAGGMIVAGKSICGQPSASATHRRSFAVAKTVHHAPWYLRREQTGHPLCRSDERTAGWTRQSLGLGRVPGRPSLHVREYKTRTYSREESLERARTRIGEDRYHPVLNNCEHFVTWCITGKTRSTQVDLLFGLTGGPWGLLLSRSGPVLHGLYRWIRTNLQRPQNRPWIRRQRDERRVK